MKKLLIILAALMMLSGGCAKPADPQEEGGETPADLVLIQVNTYGLGRIEATQGEDEPEFSDMSFTSFVFNVEKGTLVTAIAEAEEGYQFVKWTKNGDDFATETRICVAADEDAEYIAVFSLDSGFDGEPVSNVEDIRTFADILALPYSQSSTTGEHYIRVFELNGITYRAIADLTAEQSQALFDLEFDDPEYNQKENALLAPLEVARVEDLTAMIPTQAEMDKLVGKTGAELFDDGWYLTGYNYVDYEFYMVKGMFAYIMKFDGEFPSMDDFKEEEDLMNRKVTAVSFYEIHDGGYLEEE